MFDNPVFVVILLVIVAALGAAAGFFAGRAKGQDMARGAKESDLNEAKAQIEADKQDISDLNAAVVQYRTQAEGFSQQLTYLKSQLAQAQRAEEMRVERERQRAAEEANRRQAESERKLQEQSKVLSALAPVQKNLDALQTKVAQIEEGRKHEMGALGEQLKGLGEQQARLDRETSALSSALRNNKVRGAWGEAQLRNIVESAVRDHVKTLGDKAYWNAFSDAPDFVIAFIPNESLLQAALETDPTLMDDAFAQKVALTSPITLWAVLKSVAYAWQQQSLTDDAKMLFDLSRELYERFAVLGERATKLGSAITKTVGAYNSFAASLESRVLVTARKLQRVDQSKVIGTVDMIAPEKGDIRELSAPETNAE